MKIEEILKKFRMDYQFRIEYRTLKQYSTHVKQLADYTEKAFDVISKRDIRDWLNTLMEKGYKPTTIRSKLIGLRTFYNYCYEEDLIPLNPSKGISFPKVEKSMPRYLTLEQLTQLRQLVVGMVKERALIELLYATGVRLGELSAMEQSDINWSERSIHIPRGKFKKGRIVLFTAMCATHLKAYLDNRTDQLSFVFVNVAATNRLRHQDTYEQFRNYSSRLEFRLTPHMLRYTFAAHLAKKGMPLEAIQDLLGHDTPQTTQQYARLYDHARKEVYDEWM